MGKGHLKYPPLVAGDLTTRGDISRNSTRLTRGARPALATGWTMTGGRIRTIHAQANKPTAPAGRGAIAAQYKSTRRGHEDATWSLVAKYMAMKQVTRCACYNVSSTKVSTPSPEGIVMGHILS